MMKKVIKKLLAALLAVAMLCAMAIPAFAIGAATEDIKTHTFSAYQIFKGDISGSKLSNVTWGSNIGTDSADFLTALSKDTTIGSYFNKSPMTIDEVLKVISNWPDSSPEARAFARAVSAYLMRDPQNLPNPSATSIPETATIALPEAGYYLIVDKTKYDNADDYYHTVNASLLKVSDKATVNIKPKLEKPTFDKEVWDNNDITNDAGFGYSADHAIGEPFQFKLTARLPASTENIYDYYNKYAIAFTDIMSAGISYDKIDEVKINDIVISNYLFNLSEDGSYFTLAIDDVKAYNVNLNAGATVTVLYTAHLNENAAVNTENGSTTNINQANLQYSNDPNVSSSGDTTPYKEVYVYTYQLNNTKYQDEIKDGNELEGAGFRLYGDEDCTQEVKLYKVGNIYFPIKDATDKEKDAVQMISGQDGQFNVKGLDAGTYYLKEITPPDGYSACKVIPVTIKADHSRNDQVNLEGSNLTNDIVNIKAGGITLPSTGGIGTTLFYVVGGGLMVAAIVLLVTKKRMENK